MAKIQTYVNNNIYEKILDLVTARKQEGVEDANLSNVSSMLLELGLRVYMIQQERKEGGFNQREFNKVMLDNVSRVRAMCTEIMKMSTLNREVVERGDFELDVLKKAVANFASDQLSVFFPEEDVSD